MILPELQFLGQITFTFQMFSELPIYTPYPRKVDLLNFGNLIGEN